MDRDGLILKCVLVIGGLVIGGAAILSYYNGKEKSRELINREECNGTERVVYKINRYFLEPQYEIHFFKHENIAGDDSDRIDSIVESSLIISDDPNAFREEMK